ncbi:MAG: glutathione S-transferase [Candidatus Azotimanducaceae bacterium]|jgi:glutathione S-transferase
MSIKLHRHALSGHSHRVELLLSILGLESEIIDVDLVNGAHKKAEYLNKNIFGQVPVIEDGDLVLSDSNGILVYLASKYDDDRTWMPTDSRDAAEVQRFLSISAGKIAHGPAAARLVNVFGAGLDHKVAIDTSHHILTTLDSHLAERQWLATDKATIADLANYAYIAHAPEGDVSLENYPNIRAWLMRIENLAGFIPMQASKTGLAA